MMTTRTKRILLGAIASLGIAESGWAIGPRPPAVGAATPDAAHPEVGLIGNQDSVPANNQTYFATGTKLANAEALLTNNLVVTCAHAIDSEFLINRQLQYSSQTNEFKIDGQPTLRGLGIPHPNYNPLNGNNGANDVALILTAAPVPGGSAMLVGAADGLAVGNVITLVGYGGRGAAPGGPFGTRLTGTADINALTANTISFSVPVPSPGGGATNINWTEPGDSGSPYFNAAGRVVGIHNRGDSGNNPLPNPVTFAGQRATSAGIYSFLQGNGIGDAANTALILSWNANANGNFDSIVRWNSGVGAVNTPGLRHIAYINTPGQTPVITVTADTPELLGVMNDDQLDVTGGTLRITGSATAPGLFNGLNGIINVGTNRAIQTSAMDNVGAITVARQGQVLCSEASYNQAAITVNGDAVIQGPNLVFRRGIIAFNNGGRNLASGSILLNVGAFEAKGFDNRGTISLLGGVFATTNNSNLTNAGTILADETTVTIGAGMFIALSSFSTTGNLTNSGAVTLDRGTGGTIGGALSNSGAILVQRRASNVGMTASTLTVTGATTNTGTIQASDGGTIQLAAVANNGSARLAAVVGGSTIKISGNLNNAVGATVVAGSGGVVFTDIGRTVTNDGLITASGTGLANLNTVVNKGTISVGSGGRYTGDNLNNSGTVSLVSGSMFVSKNPGSAITNSGTITINGFDGAPGLLVATSLASPGLVKISNRSVINGIARALSGQWRSETPPPRSSADDPDRNTGIFDLPTTITVNTTIGPTAFLSGPGVEMIAGNAANFSLQSSLFDMTATELSFIDPEELRPIEDVEDETQIFLPSPTYATRDVSNFLWPSSDVTHPGPGTLGHGTVYVNDLELAPDSGDNSGTTTIMIDGSPVIIQNKTTLDVRGGKIYMAGTLTYDSATTVIRDSLNSTRPLSDIIEVVPSLPSSNFAIDSLFLDGGDYVILRPAFNQWGVNASGSWNVGPNWTSGMTPNGTLAAALFGQAITAPVNVSIAAPVSVNLIIFDNANAYTLSGPAALTLDADAGLESSIHVASGSHAISAPTILAVSTTMSIAPASSLQLTANLSGSGSVSKLGDGTLVLSGPASTFTGETQVLAGMVVVAGSQALGSPTGATRVASGAALAFQGDVNHTSAEPTFVAGTGGGLGAIQNLSGDNVYGGTITLEADSSLRVNAGSLKVGDVNGDFLATKIGVRTLTANHFRTAGLTISEGLIRVLPNGTSDSTSRVGSLSIAGGPTVPTATLDLTNNALVVDYLTGEPSPLQDIRGYIAAAFAGGAWNGNGITSSLANSFAIALGFAEASSLGSIPAIFGNDVDSSAVLVWSVRYGDADLNGLVNLADFNRLAANFGLFPGAVWSQGDFTYDGRVSLFDFNRLAANFGLSAGPDGPTPADWAALASAVPEPAGLLPLLLTGGMLRRSRRRN